MIQRQCVAMHSDGGRCPFNSSIIVADTLPLCDKHATNLAEIFESKIVPAPMAYTPGLIYYAHNNYDTMKIGYTTHLAGRMNSIQRECPNMVLVATEPGTTEYETQLHHTWKHLCFRGREWYRWDDNLLAHMYAVREQHGILARVSKNFLA